MSKNLLLPVELHKKYNVVIDAFSHEGEGIGRVDNFAIFIPGAIKGEKVEVKITEIKKSFAKGKLIKVIDSNENRKEPFCKWSDSCGGCGLQHLTYKGQLEMKREIVENSLKKLGGIDVDVLPTIGMDIPLRYRNKGQFQVEKKDGKVKLGFYEKNSYDLISSGNCLLFSEAMNRLVRFLERVLTDEKIKVYNRKEKTGFLRNIVIRESGANKELLIVFVTNNKANKLTKVVEKVMTRFPEVTSIYQNVNSDPRPVVLGKDFKLLAGNEIILDILDSFGFGISPESFFQVNNVQTEVLYKKAVEYAHLTGNEIVVDAYCGIGTISLFMAEKCKKVYGIEMVEKAIEDAKKNAEVNEIENAEFIKGKVENWLPKWVKEGNKTDVIVVDPPRKGCQKETLTAMVEANPKTIVYVSCNPATLARDLKYLVENNYEVKEVQPVDMFPQTNHVECSVLIERKSQ